MKTKKKLLFVNESLSLAGGEKSLIALLNNLDPNLYEVDLQLFKYGGELDEFIPEYVHVLPPLPYALYAENSWKTNFLQLLKGLNWRFFKSKLTYSINIRKGEFNHPEKAQLYWESVGTSISKSTEKYDIAIAYAQGIPTFYVIDKIDAQNKITWLNAKPNFPLKNKVFQRKYYEKYDIIVPVSEVTFQQLKSEFPEMDSKMHVLKDIVDYQSILKMADMKVVDFNSEVFNILTVARLNYKSKRYDITLGACKILRDKGIRFHWYALGEGEYRQEMENFIKENKLESHFTLLGTTVNPYPYFKAADLYVQTSELEAYGISIAEARLLNTPVVTTRFDTVFMQMVDGKNGLVTDMNAEAVAEAIIRIINDKTLYNSIVEYLKNEEKENTETIKRFDAMINNLLSNN
ncbi:glycosyltransferase [Aequorivita sinensis]|uniref:glycosyltransferase n=1 Tax=Aequorivita sinensis TaxID=1382458 RepID=UPI00230061AA|nr:glycosyltransferase [Aequorivita sinensis]